MPGKPGLYTLTYDDSAQIEKVFSVNPSPNESQLAYVDSPEALKTWRVNLPETAPKPASSAARTSISLTSILQQQWWWWMVLGGLLALLLEMAVAEIKKTDAGE